MAIKKRREYILFVSKRQSIWSNGKKIFANGYTWLSCCLSTHFSLSRDQGSIAFRMKVSVRSLRILLHFDMVFLRLLIRLNGIIPRDCINVCFSCTCYCILCLEICVRSCFNHSLYHLSSIAFGYMFLQYFLWAGW